MNARTLFVCTLLLVVPLAGCASNTTPTPTPVVGVASTDDFEGATLGELPVGWTSVAGNWSVAANDTAPNGSRVLSSAQTDLGETTILHDAAGSWSDLDARAMFNVQAGEKGQAGGIVLRYEDAQNYYVVRYNHNELSWNLFRTIEGDREKFPGTDEGAEAFHGALNEWTEIRVEAKGDHIVVYSGDVKVIDYTEASADAPFAGKVGLWTRYDSKTEFDAWSVGPL